MFRHATKNRAFRLVWNAEQLMFVPAPEGIRAHGAGAGSPASALGMVAAAVTALFASTAAQAIDPLTQPIGGRVAAGQASISQTAQSTTVQQTTARAAIDWHSFSVGSQAHVDFVQPSAGSVVLNRVVGQDPSQILGRIQANGQVFIVNPNGVLFAPGARVDAAGVLASTRDMAVADFMADRLVLSGSSPATVVNGGSLTAARGGYVVLVGAQVVNDGSLAAPLGDVRMAAADRVTLRIDNGGLAAFDVDRGTLDGLVANRGLVRAEGGRIFLTADALDALSRGVVNNQGVVEARTVENHAGTIVLKGDMKVGHAIVGGTLDASAPGGGDGGFIETSAAHVQVGADARVTTASTQAAAGTWLIDPTDFRVAASGGDMSGAQLSSALGTGNVTIRSTAGSGGTAGNVTVDDRVAWSANRLTLEAQADIHLNAHMAGSAGASLALQYGQSSVAAGNTAGYTVADGVTIDLPAGNTFSTRRGSDGATTTFRVFTSLGADGSTTGTDLQGMQGSLGGHYALGADIAAGATAAWRAGRGFAPVGSSGTPFSGALEGLGHAVDGLTVNDTASASGLFGMVGGTGSVTNLRLTRVSITSASGNVGGLAGISAGRVDHVSVQGSVRGAEAYVGGLVGVNDGLVSGSRAVNIDVASTSNTVGGLVGYNAAGSVVGSTSSGSVRGESYVGGLIGMSLSSLDGLSSSADVAGGDVTGGLAGQINGGVSHSSATGNVAGRNNTGGLVAITRGNISDSFATGNVTATGFEAGGLVGTAAQQDDGYAVLPVSIVDSYATGRVSATGDRVGGLVGSAFGVGLPSSNLQASGAVSGRDDVGGLFGAWASGEQGSAVTASHAGGNVSGANHVGGLIGNMKVCFCELTNAYASGNVFATGSQAGGLVGTVDTGNLSGVHASGNVSGLDQVGGLAGYAQHVSDASASGSVAGRNAVGGLVGQTKVGGTVANTHATGAVTGTGNGAGGLVGSNAATITGDSWTTSPVDGNRSVGGLVGVNDGAVDDARTGNLGVAQPVVTGVDRVGGLVGDNEGSITSAASTGAVLASGTAAGGLVGYNHGSITLATATGTVTGVNSVGGLIGENDADVDGLSALQAVTGSGTDVGGFIGTATSGRVTNASASGRVDGVASVGGFVGNASAGTVFTHDVASGAVTGTSAVGGFVGSNATVLSGNAVDGNLAAGDVTGTGHGSGVGGYAGSNSGTLREVTAGLAVKQTGGGSDVGGLLGINRVGGLLEASQAHGDVVSDGSHVGGLVGSNAGGTIATSYSTGSVTGVDQVGGLVGADSGTIGIAYATGSVIGRTVVGGLTGQQSGGAVTTNAYATGGVSGASVVGGVFGSASGSSRYTYANGSVRLTGGGASTAEVGGFAGVSSGATVVDSFFDVERTGRSNASGSSLQATGAALGKTTAQMNSAATFAGWSLGVTGGQGRAWRSYDTLAAPLLMHWLTPMTIAGNGGAITQVYDGTVHSQAAQVSFTETLPPGHLLGRPSYVGARNVGVYGALGGQYSDQQGYDLSYATPGTLTITPAPLAVSLVGVTKAYDGNTVATLLPGNFRIDGLGTGDMLNVGTTIGTYDSRNVRDASSVSATLAAGSITAATGTLLSNYLLPTLPTVVTGAGAITPKPLAITGSVPGKVYDGTTTAPGATLSVDGVIAGDSFGVSGTGRFDTPDVGTAKPVTIGLVATGTDAANYSFASTARTTADINAATVSPPTMPPVEPVVPVVPIEPIEPKPISSQQPTPALGSALVSLPNVPSGADGGGPRTVGTPASGVGLVSGPIAADSVAVSADPAKPVSVVSGVTRENLLYRRTFAIGDGGMRLPAGVAGSEKDASQ